MSTKNWVRNLLFAGYFLSFFCFSELTFAAPMSEDLWGGIKNSDITTFKDFSLAIGKNDYKKSLEIAEKSKENSVFSGAMLDISLWNKYSHIDEIDPKNINFEDISKFVENKSFFPNLTQLRSNVEKIALLNKIPQQILKKYFEQLPALSPESKIYLLQAQISSKKDKTKDAEIIKSVSEIWFEENFLPEKEKQFLAEYGKVLKLEDYIKRIKRLIWEGKESEAKRIVYLLDDDHRKLFLAIMSIDKNSKTISNFVESVPTSLRNDDLLLYKIVVWYGANGRDLKKIVNIVENLPSDISNVKKWWQIRKLYGRELLKNKEYESAYKIFSKHGIKPKSKDFDDAEWTSGWIALRFLNDPKTAYKHFNDMYLNVSYPASLSRSSYWLGMASIAMGDKQKAINWYKIASGYPTYFYGQLAIHKRKTLDSINSQYDIIVPKDSDILSADISAMRNSQPLKVAYILALIGDIKNATNVFEYTVANAKTNGEIAVIYKVAKEIENNDLNLAIYNEAAKRNVFFIKDKFRVIKEIADNSHSALLHSIIKQESRFYAKAVSPVGALGLMQIMPETARLICQQIGTKYNKEKLTSDMSYNIILGSYYIQSLIDKFDGSELLAVAAYNAGPNASQRWVDEFYDPRKEKDVDKVVDWIELITYSETRNYVQRIMENIIIYKYLMSRVNYDEIK